MLVALLWVFDCLFEKIYLSVLKQFHQSDKYHFNRIIYPSLVVMKAICKANIRQCFGNTDRIGNANQTEYSSVKCHLPFRQFNCGPPLQIPLTYFNYLSYLNTFTITQCNPNVNCGLIGLDANFIGKGTVILAPHLKIGAPAIVKEIEIKSTR